MIERASLLVLAVAGFASCAPAEPLPALTPKPAAGALAGVRIAIRCRRPGVSADVQLCRAYEKAYADVGVVVVVPTEAHALRVTIEKPLSEWGAANRCFVTTTRSLGGPPEPPAISRVDVPRDCDQPNVPDHAVAAWLADPAIATAAAESRVRATEPPPLR